MSFASRALTDTETRYAQIEKEMLAIIYSLNKFHQYTYGRHTYVVTDHKPLQNIARKQLDQVPRRLQGMVLQLQHYDTTIEYRPGKELVLADTLSRAFLRQDKAEPQVEVNVVTCSRICQDSLQQIAKATTEDETMQALRKMILTGWPESSKEVPEGIRMYYQFKDELTVDDDLVYRGQRVVIPLRMRNDVKKKLHSAHMGTESLLRRARECIYWPNMNGDIKDFVMACEICQTHSVKQQRETLVPHPIPELPWERVGLDLMECQGKSFL